VKLPETAFSFETLTFPVFCEDGNTVIVTAPDVFQLLEIFRSQVLPLPLNGAFRHQNAMLNQEV